MPKGIWKSPDKNWHEPELLLLRQGYGILAPGMITERINAWRIGQGFPPRTKTAIQVKAKKLKLNAKYANAEGMVPTADVLENLGHRAKVYEYLRGKATREAGKVQVQGKGRHRFIRVADAERLQDLFPPIPDGFISAKAASDYLGFGCRALASHCRNESIPYVKHGHSYFVPEKLVKAAEAELRRTGGLKLRWKQLTYSLGMLPGSVYRRAA